MILTILRHITNHKKPNRAMRWVFLIAISTILNGCLLISSRNPSINASAQESYQIYLPLVASPQAPRVNVPNLLDPSWNNSVAIFWYGRVTPDENYTDVRIAYTPTELYLRLDVFDRLLWYNPSPGATNLTSWDGATLLLSTNRVGSPLYRFDAEMTWWEPDRSQFQASFRNSGSGWQPAKFPFTTESVGRGNSPNDDVDDRGWWIDFHIPFSSLGLSSPPSPQTEWRLMVITHDRDSNAGPPNPDKMWPENANLTLPGTWGELNFGVPNYTPRDSVGSHDVKLQNGLNGITVKDAGVGGFSVCGERTDFFGNWGDQNESFYNHKDQFNIQSQADVADFPCFSKYYVTFPLNSIPPGKVIKRATLTLYQFGNAGYVTTDAKPSYIWVTRIGQDWDEDTITWNNAPLAIENYGGVWVDPLTTTYSGVDGVARTWDISRAVDDAYRSGQHLRLAMYSADWPMHSGKYFYSSDYGNPTSRPTLDITWGDPVSVGGN